MGRTMLGLRVVPSWTCFGRRHQSRKRGKVGNREREKIDMATTYQRKRSYADSGPRTMQHVHRAAVAGVAGAGMQ